MKFLCDPDMGQGWITKLTSRVRGGHPEKRIMSQISGGRTLHSNRAMSFREADVLRDLLDEDLPRWKWFAGGPKDHGAFAKERRDLSVKGPTPSKNHHFQGNVNGHPGDTWLGLIPAQVPSSNKRHKYLGVSFLRAPILGWFSLCFGVP